MLSVEATQKSGFTVADGWARGFLPAQTAEMTGRSTAEVTAEYLSLDEEYSAYVEEHYSNSCTDDPKQFTFE
jgi:squalene cyclase